MPLQGDFAALADFYTRLRKFSETGRRIATELAPKVEGLVGQTFAAQAGPNGEAWPATKSGAPAFGGGDAGGRVLSRLAGKASVRTTVLYPLHFHQDGTHVVGKKRGAAIRRSITGNAGKLAAAGVKVPRKGKDESEFAYQQRLAAGMARRAARAEAVRAVRHQVAFAVLQARTAGGWHDPPRPMIPGEGDPVPDTWTTTIVETARPILAEIGAK
jgi:hypothetical protein